MSFAPSFQLNALAGPALQGLLLCGSLIVAIGAQNAFLLRQGLRHEHVAPLVLACSLADAVLIALGVAGLAGLLGARPQLAQAMAAAGVLFLLAYGLRALWQARKPSALQAAQGESLSLRAALLQLAGFTLLNPHVYLDTVLLMGSVGAQQTSDAARAAFVVGASSASLIWFTGLGFGARKLAPLFAKPRAWQVFDALIGLVMLLMAWQLIPLATGVAAA
ncbi:LysE/ArgO family amino acid transporter [Ideonella azotifigens]|uniref:LysE/ArgO family amino acid transporter n=2 Tax=Ideonella azotifigens TaxID=513160 RepID=A0ABP3VI78_9BURK|nr:LysE/ArgO family amino acid transporter [Ideonella azotifigens]MCD2338904.1 LysE/ArgO family amino acid transporter [Ideonella azotifigens]